jgi:hypothetical protein
MSQGFRANGNISPSRIVKIDGTQPGVNVIQAAAATGALFGIAQAGTHNAPLSGFDDGYAAIAGLDVTVFTVGDLCQVEIGAAVNAGDLLTSDGNGRAITATTGNYVVGQAEQNGTTLGQVIKMKVNPYKI